MRCTWVIVIMLAGAWVEVAQAQGPPLPSRPPTTPPLSPYINLGRGGNPALNYYGLVRPQQDFRSSILQLQRQAANQQIQTEVQDPTLPTTGHPTRFLNLGAYFLNSSGQVGSARGIAAGFSRPSTGGSTGIGAGGGLRR